MQNPWNCGNFVENIGAIGNQTDYKIQNDFLSQKYQNYMRSPQENI